MMIYMNFGTQGRAVQAQTALKAGGVPANLVNTPRALAEKQEGCSYSVQFPEPFREKAAQILRRKGIRAEMRTL